MLVDSEGRAVGSSDLLAAHRAPGLKHRAFTLLVIDAEDHLVLAQRSADKPLWPNHWDGTVASHPVAGESSADAARRRAREELGIEVVPREVGTVDYRVDDPSSATSPLGPLAEHEFCAVLVARLAPGVVLRPDPSEVSAIRRVSVASLLEASRDVWAVHCPWLPLALEVVRSRSSRATRPFEQALAPLAAKSAEPALAAAIAALVPGGTWRVE